MKQLILTAILLIIISSTTAAQTMADVMNDRTDLTWIGLDFTNAKLVPNIEFENVSTNAKNAFEAWNNLLEQEAEKFSMCTALEITRCKNNTSFTRHVNDEVTADEALSRDSYSLDKSLIPEMVKQYETTGEGVGVVFIVSTFDKRQVIAEYHVTFFDMDTKEILLSQPVTTTPMGFGTRNYWAGSVYSALKEIRATYAKAWREQYK